MEGGSKGDSWPPSTPLKDIMQMMHPEMQENQVEWMGLGRRITPGFGDDLNVPLPGRGKSVMVSDDAGIGVEHEFEALEGITFSDLLGLRDVAPAQGNGGIDGQSCISIENFQTGSSFNGMLLSGQCFVPGSTAQSNSNWITENSGVSVPHKHSYDLNFAPDMEGNAVSGLDIARFAPMTPEKPGNAENDQVAEIQNVNVCEQINQERNDNEGVMRIDDNSIEGPSQPVTDSSGPVVSTPLKDNQNSDEGDNKKKPRRRKHRPKIAIEGKKPKQDSKPVTSKPGGSKDNLRVKRKYVRRKGVNKTTTLSEEPSGVLAGSATIQPPRKSCRRALDFNTPEQQCGSSAPKSVTNLDSESRVQSENIQAGFASDLTGSVTQVLSSSFQMNRNTSEEILDVEKGQVTVQDKQEGTANNMLGIKNQTALGSAGANEEVQARISKRKYSLVIEQASNTNRNGAHYNSLQAYEHWLHIPNTCKKKRSENGRKSVKLSTSSHLNEMETATWPSIMCSNSDSKAYTFAAKANYLSFTPPQPTTSQVPAILRKSGSQGLEAKQRTKLHLMALTEPERLTNEASSTPTRVCELASMNRSAVCQAQTTSSALQGSVSGTENLQKQYACRDLVADMQPTVAKRKRSKKRNSFTSINKTQLHQQIAVHQFSTEPSAFNAGAAAAEVIKQGFIDVITERLKFLNINSESDRVIIQERDALVHYNQDRNALFLYNQDQNALVPYNQHQNAFIPYNQHQNALVLYRSDGTVVPFQGPFNPIKPKRPRPKVDLDEETNRVFQLLLENINNEGVDGTDEEKRKWWEEERRVFCARADSFVARMHLVQGDRRFSQWKGSVVDSVVGVFLTQNVTDHLSSSAFLSLAARYPLKSNSNHKPLHKEDTTLLVKEAEVCVPDPDTEQTTEWKENTSNQRISDQSSVTFHDNEYTEEKEVVSSNVSPGNKTAEVILTEKINCSSINSSESDVETYHKITRTETSSFARYDIATNAVVSSQISLNIVEYPIAQTSERTEPYLEGNLEAEKLKNRLQVNNSNDSTSLMDLLSMGGSTMQREVSDCKCDRNYKDVHSSSDQSIVTAESTSQGTVQEKVTVTVQESPTSYSENDQSSNLQGDENMIQSRNWFVGDTNAETLARGLNNKEQETLDITESTISDKRGNNKQKTAADKALESAKQKNRRVGTEINNEFEWDTLRRDVEANGKKERLSNTIDSLDWEAVRCADVNEIAETIKERGMNNVLAARIKAFLNRVVNDHGSIDLEWLRDIEADKAKEYLLSIRGLGLKSVECVRLLTLQHLAFPVDTNVGRIAVRLGWVPLQPLPDSLQLHLLEQYPVMESIQRYLWPRLCKLKQEELYELHYQMITFGKVFCTKTKPNCNACPMRGECRHFASAFASGRLALPAPEEKSIVSVPEKTSDPDTTLHTNALPLPPPQTIQPLEGNLQLEAILTMDKKCVVGSCEPIIEQPASPEPESTQYQECDIEDSLYDDSDDIPTIKLNIEEFTQNLQHYMKDNMELQEGEMSKALVALTPEAASIPMPKLKNVSRLRTEHQVYELPDSHPLLEGMDKREPDDPCTYLLAIWAPGETANSVQPSEGGCSYQESGKLCDRKTCFLCNSIREANSQMVRGTLLIPCRTATRGRFPLNGTYFQVNEVFADHASSLNPIDIPRQWLWNLPRKTVFFGTSVSSIFKGLSTEEIQHCFWRGHVCVRGFDHKTRAPRPLVSRLHSSLAKAKGKMVDE